MTGASNGQINNATAPFSTSGGGAVTSVFGRTGAVVAQIGDYNISQISGAGTAAAMNLSAVIINNGSGALTIGAGQVTQAMLAAGVGVPGGANTSIQFNNSGSFGGFGTWDGTTFDVGTGKGFKGQYSNSNHSAYINPDGSAVFGAGGMVITNVGNISVPAFKLTTSPTNGYVLTSDASGNGSWQAGGGSSAFTIDVSNNIISSNAGAVSGSNNFFAGLNAGGAGSTSGGYNNFIGSQAGYTNSGGSNNNFLGNISGYLNTSGSNNLFFGLYSGYTNTTGSNNIAIGQAVACVSATASGQMNIGNVIFGTGMYDGTFASGVPSSIGKIGLGTATPAVRLHIIGQDATLADPSAFSVSLVSEVPVAAVPIDTPTLFYQPVAPTSSGLGYDATQTTGSGNYVANGQTISATVYEGRTLGGQDLVDPTGFSLSFVDTINDGTTTFFLDWVWTSSNNSDGSTPDFLIFANATTGYTYRITPGTATIFNDTATDPGSVPSYVTFTGFNASGQTFNFDILAFGTSPTGQTYYSTTDTPYSVADAVNNGSLLQIRHVISSSGSDGWKIIQGGAGSQSGANNLTFYQDASFSGPTTTTPVHYGFLSDGSILNRAYTANSRNVGAGQIFSTGQLFATTIDNNDGLYYSITGAYSTVGEGIRATESINGGSQLYKDVMLGTSGFFYIDALGGTFTGAPVILTPTFLSYTAILAENTSDDTAPVAQIRMKTTNANALLRWEMWEQNTLRAYQQHGQTGDYTFFNSNGIYRFITANANAPTIALQDSSGNYFGGFANDGSLSLRRSASGAQSALTIGTGDATHTQIVLDNTTTVPTTPINGGIEYSSSNFYGTDSSVRRAFLRSTTSTRIYNGNKTATGTATTTFTVTIGATLGSATYNVNVTPTNALSAAIFYVNNKTTTTFDVVYLAGLTGAVAFDWALHF